MKYTAWSSKPAASHVSHHRVNGKKPSQGRVREVLVPFSSPAPQTLRARPGFSLKDLLPGSRAQRSVDWTDKGYADAQRGVRAYPHSGGCQCGSCQAYWSGYAGYTLGM